MGRNMFKQSKTEEGEEFDNENAAPERVKSEKEQAGLEKNSDEPQEQHVEEDEQKQKQEEKEQDDVETSGDAPHLQEMKRLGSTSPVRFMETLTTTERDEISKKECEALSTYFRNLSLLDIANNVTLHKIDGGGLKKLNEKDLDKMEFKTIGERKALQVLCEKLLEDFERKRRVAVIIERRVPFDGQVHEWKDGPCSELNCCSMKDKNTRLDSCWKSSSCNADVAHHLPLPKVFVRQDQLILEHAEWDGSISETMRNLTTGFSKANRPPFSVKEEVIEMSRIVDIDYELFPKQEDYEPEPCDWFRKLTCQKLRRDPNMGEFYWQGPVQSCCGFDRFYTEKPDGVIHLLVRRKPENADEPSKGEERKTFHVLQGTKEVVDAIVERLASYRTLSNT